MSCHGDGYRWRCDALAQVSEHVKSVAIRKRQIEEHQVDRSVGGGLHGVGDVCGNVYSVPGIFQKYSECVRYEGAVLHYEDISLLLRQRVEGSGNVKKKRLPLPSSLSTQISPPCSSTSFRAMASPRPVPWCGREGEESTCANSLNTSS